MLGLQHRGRWGASLEDSLIDMLSAFPSVLLQKESHRTVFFFSFFFSPCLGDCSEKCDGEGPPSLLWEGGIISLFRTLKML